MPTFVAALRASAPRAAALEKLEDVTSHTRLFDPAWLAKACDDSRGRFPRGPRLLTPFAKRSIRWRASSASNRASSLLPDELRDPVQKLLGASIEPSQALGLIRREALAAEIASRLAADPHLQEIDPHRLETAFNRYRDLDTQKRELTRFY